MTAGVELVRNTSRTEYFDVLRCAAIVCVVVLHAAAARWPYLEPDTVQWQVLNVYDGAVRFCVPIFFMISGALFLDPSRNVTIQSIVRRSLPRLAISYVVWSGLFALFTAFVITGYAGGWALVSSWVTGHYHLWFLLALMGLYVVTPLLRRICESESLARYFVALAMLFAVVLPMLTPIPRIGPMVATVLDTAQVHLVLGYSVYFVLGHLLHTGLLARTGTGWVITAGALATAVTVLSTSLRSVQAGAGDDWYYGYVTPNVVVASSAVFILAKRWGEKHRLRGRTSRVVMLVGGCSFGIYLVHPIFQELLSLAGVTTDAFPAVFSVPVLTALVLIPSLAVAWSLRRIPVVGQYLG